MQSLPLYDRRTIHPIELVADFSIEASCSNCIAGNTAIGYYGEKGGLLVIGGNYKPNLGYGNHKGSQANYVYWKIVRAMVSDWKGPIAYDFAVRCDLDARAAKYVDICIANCRLGLAKSILEISPQKIFLLGSKACISVIGYAPHLRSVRKGYAAIRDLSNKDRFIPVFFFPDPDELRLNKLFKSWAIEDASYACNADIGLDSNNGSEPDKTIHIVETIEDSIEAIKNLTENHELISIDVETCGNLYTHDFRLLSLAMSTANCAIYCYAEKALADIRILEPLYEMFSNPLLRFCGANVSFDQQAIFSYLSKSFDTAAFDVRLARKLLDPDVMADLGTMSELVGMQGLKFATKDLIDSRLKMVKKVIQGKKRNEVSKKKSKSFKSIDSQYNQIPKFIRDACEASLPDYRYGYALLDQKDLIQYNCKDVQSTLRLADLLDNELQADNGLYAVWKDVIMPAANALYHIQRFGVCADRKQIELSDNYFQEKENELNGRLSKYDIDWNSPKQVSDLLFNKLKLSSIKSTDKGASSTDKFSLERLAKSSPICQDLIDFRLMGKLKSLYGLNMLQYIGFDGRIHPSLKMETRSGRLSCNEPVLHGMPRPSTFEGKLVRDIIRAEKGKSLIELDLSQVELRIAAMLSQDKAMTAIFKEGVDFHQRTAELISKVAWDIDPSQVTSNHRSIAKTVNFGVLYGKSNQSFAKDWGVSLKVVEKIVNAIFGAFKGLRNWIDSQKDQVKKTGYVRSWWNGGLARYRYLPNVFSEDTQERNAALRSAVNTPIQSTASDFCLRSMAEIVNWILKERIEDKVKLILTIHDSLLLEVADEMVHEVADRVRGVMTGWNSLDVPLVADCNVGKSWGQMEALS